MDYVIFLLVVIFIILELIIKNNIKKNNLFKLMMLLFTVIGCLRSYKVGTDTYFYFYDYTLIPEMSFTDLSSLRYEFGFSLLCKLLGTIFADPQFLLVFTSVFMNFVTYKFIKNNTKNHLLAGIFFFTLNYYFEFLCLMRQGIALSFILISYEKLKNNKNIQFLLFLIIATLFHTSAIIMLLMYPIKKIKRSNLVLPTAIFGSLLTFILIRPIFNFLAININDYSKYILSEYNAASYVSGGLYSLTSLLFLMFGLIVPNRKNIKEKLDENEYSLLAWIITIGTIISVASIKIAIFHRLYMYFGFFIIIWLEKNIEVLSDKNKTIWKLVIYTLTFCYVLVITNLGWYDVIPYTFFWEV